MIEEQLKQQKQKRQEILVLVSSIEKSISDPNDNKFLKLLENLVFLERVMYRTNNQHSKTCYYQRLKACKRFLKRIHWSVGSNDEKYSMYALAQLLDHQESLNHELHYEYLVRASVNACEYTLLLVQEIEKAYVYIRRSLLMPGYFMPLGVVMISWCANTWIIAKDFLLDLLLQLKKLNRFAKDNNQAGLTKFEDFLKSRNVLEVSELDIDFRELDQSESEQDLQPLKPIESKHKEELEEVVSAPSLPPLKRKIGEPMQESKKLQKIKSKLNDDLDDIFGF